MSGSPGETPSKPAWWLWLVIGAALIAITLIIVLVATQLPSGNAGAGSPTPTPTSSPSGPTPSGEPTPVPPETASPVPIDEPATIEPGLTAQLDRFEAVQGEARGPGEVSGPAIRFRLTISNSGSAPIDLRGTVVTVAYGPDRIPALELFEPGGVPLAVSVAPGEKATAVYIFTIPVDEREVVGITVDYAISVPPLVFTGSVPAD